MDRHGHSDGQGMGGGSSERTREWAQALRKGPEFKNSMWECLWGEWGTAWTVPVGRLRTHVTAVGQSS